MQKLPIMYAYLIASFALTVLHIFAEIVELLMIIELQTVVWVLNHVSLNVGIAVMALLIIANIADVTMHIDPGTVL
jgi:hypothetical protein